MLDSDGDGPATERVSVSLLCIIISNCDGTKDPHPNFQALRNCVPGHYQLIISPHGKPQLPGHMTAGLLLTEGSNGQKESTRMSK